MKTKWLIGLVVVGALALAFVAMFLTLNKDPESGAFKSSYFLLMNDALEFPLEKDYKVSCTGVKCSIKFYKKQSKDHARITAFLAVAKAPEQVERKAKEDFQPPQPEIKKLPEGDEFSSKSVEFIKSCKGQCFVGKNTKGDITYETTWALFGEIGGTEEVYYK